MAEIITLGLSNIPAPMREMRVAPITGKRAYDAAAFTRLTEDWSTWTTSADLDLWADIYRLRARARRTAQNNPIARKAQRIYVKNVVGPDGVRLRMKVPMKKGKKLNMKLNTQVEQLFAQWGRRENCTIQGNMSWKFAQRFAALQAFRDGECFIRRRYPKNKFNFGLQFLDPDQLDTNYYLWQMPNGNTIRMGIEQNPDGMPVAYHFWDKHPAEWSISPKNRIRVPAEDVIHLYDPERVMQSRGVSQLASSLLTMHMLNQYTMAEVVAARVAAAKMGFFKKTGTDAGFEGDERDEERRIKMKAEPGTMEQLPEGVDFQPWDPQHPTTAFPAFTKMLLRMVGAGADMSYETLANDREGVNYSSIRAGLLDDRDTWRTQQSHFAETVCDRVFGWFLQSAWLSGLVELDGAPEDYAIFADWRGRGWQWIDPLKDMEANAIAETTGQMTRTELLEANGKDFEETMQTYAYEREFIGQLGLTFGLPPGVRPGASDQPADSPDSQGNGEGESNGGDGGK